MGLAVERQKMQTVLLSGSLARMFGREHRVAITGGFKEVMGYFRQFPGFERYMVQSADQGLRFAVFNGRRNLSETDIHQPLGKEVIRIAPVLSGSKRAGGLQTILGAVLMAVAYYNPFGFLTGPAASFLMMTGVSMAMGGVMQMLAPLPKGLAAQDSPESRSSYSFNGPVNTSAQGNPVGLLYGQLTIGSAVISSGIYAEDQL
ncbi:MULTISPECIES: tail assembly protein [Pseudomonas]|uniref:Tail assembly protein n=1 Tax=Pseudomonas protegens TaxID=380021 RepID=A0A2T6GN67_9PSED|nr:MULTISPECIES: tail assembly protein [Pseudomonas]PUA45603.1 tail assembly protein [Pseudomonas protegens]ULT69574.1 tail assembly protein [Pseudomonas sp. BC42]BAQ79151.1 bacteriophage lambda tail assembly protein I [Pseudomonas sp. St29]